MQALAYLSGNFDRRGGLLFHPLGRPLSQLMQRLGIGVDPEPSRVGGFTGIFDELPGGILADEMLTPGPEQIRALIVIAGDPLRSIPGAARLGQALAGLDFQMQIDLFPNASSETADLLLPAASWLERWDVATTAAILQHTPHLQYGGPVLAPPGQARSERRILADLSLALDRPLWGNHRLARWWGRWPLDRMLTRLLNGLTFPYRWRHGGAAVLPAPRPKPGRYLGRGPLTPGRQVRFWHPELEGEGERLMSYAKQLREAAVAAAGALPLTLIGRRRRLGHNGWLHGGARDGKEEAAAWLSPADFARLGLGQGDDVTIRGNGATIRLPAVAQQEVGPGTVVVPHGLNEVNVNDVIPSGVTAVEPISGNHHMTGIPVTVRKS
jgi:formate dehydrogenase